MLVHVLNSMPKLSVYLKDIDQNPKLKTYQTEQ